MSGDKTRLFNKKCINCTGQVFPWTRNIWRY